MIRDSGLLFWATLYMQRATSLMDTVNRNSSYSPVEPRVCLFMFFRLNGLSLRLCMLCFTFGQLSHFLSCFGAGITNLNGPPRVFCFLPITAVRSWLHPFKGHCEQKAMRDERAIYVAGHPLLNRRCTRFQGCFHFPKRKLNYMYKF